MRLFLTTILACLLTLPTLAQGKQTPTLFAHRGCWSQNENKEFIVPENSLPAVAMAKRMGYTGIECDVHYTKDNVMVILHDATLNRTMRRASDYSKLDKPVKLADLTFEELRRDYVLESTNPEWRTPIPTLEELLAECKKHGIIPMLHSALMPSYHVAQQMFGNEWICFTGGVEHMQQVRKYSDCTILLSINDGTAEGIAFTDIPAFSVQYHPEANPGPTDSHYLFTAFTRLMDGREDYLDIDIARERLDGWKF